MHVCYVVFTARCYAERGYEIACRLSVLCLHSTQIRAHRTNALGDSTHSSTSST